MDMEHTKFTVHQWYSTG